MTRLLEYSLKKRYLNSLNILKGAVMAKKHIALYIGSLNKGGAERVLVNLAEYFYGKGYDVTFVTTFLYPDEYEVKNAAWSVVSGEGAGKNAACDVVPGKGEGSCADKEEACSSENSITPFDEQGSGIKRIMSGLTSEEESGGRLKNITARCDKLKSVWKKIKPDIIISFLGKNNVMALISSVGLGIPVVVSVRSNPAREYRSRVLRMAMLSTFRLSSGVVLQTEGAKAFFPGNIQAKAVILPNSLDESFIREVFKGARDKTIVSVGRLDDNKNQGMIIKAFAIASAEHPGYKLVLYGDGPSKDKFKELAKKLGVAEKVEFAGLVSGVADKISRAGMFILSSKEEGMPNALLEAMALGIPCISTNCPCGGPADLIENKVNGRLVPVGATKQMSECMSEYMDNPKRAAELGLRASNVQKIYSPKAVNEAWEKYLMGIME